MARSFRQTKTVFPDLISVPAGSFLMGCDQGRADERPVHRVTVDAFQMGIYAVTNEQYQCFVVTISGSMPASFSESRFSDARQPVVALNWFEATAYCEWLSKEMGGSYRLPTEAEWEWAARAGKEGLLYGWGDQSPGEFEIYRIGWRDERPEPVGLHPPNAFGLYNMGDNVHEWCLDWYVPDFYQISPENNPVNRTPTARRASRGGSWRHQIKVSRCAARSSLDPSFGYTDYGFRIVKDLRSPGLTASQLEPDTQ